VVTRDCPRPKPQPRAAVTGGLPCAPARQTARAPRQGCKQTPREFAQGVGNDRPSVPYEVAGVQDHHGEVLGVKLLHEPPGAARTGRPGISRSAGSPRSSPAVQHLPELPAPRVLPESPGQQLDHEDDRDDCGRGPVASKPRECQATMAKSWGSSSRTNSLNNVASQRSRQSQRSPRRSPGVQHRHELHAHRVIPDTPGHQPDNEGSCPSRV
jgi:hypothetical protein